MYTVQSHVLHTVQSHVLHTVQPHVLHTVQSHVLYTLQSHMYCTLYSHMYCTLYKVTCAAHCTITCTACTLYKVTCAAHCTVTCVVHCTIACTAHCTVTCAAHCTKSHVLHTVQSHSQVALVQLCATRKPQFPHCAFTVDVKHATSLLKTAYLNWGFMDFFGGVLQVCWHKRCPKFGQDSLSELSIWRFAHAFWSQAGDIGWRVQNMRHILCWHKSTTGR